MTEVRNSRCNLFNLMQVQILLEMCICRVFVVAYIINEWKSILVTYPDNQRPQQINTSTLPRTTINAKQSSVSNSTKCLRTTTTPPNLLSAPPSSLPPPQRQPAPHPHLRPNRANTPTFTRNWHSLTRTSQTRRICCG